MKKACKELGIENLNGNARCEERAQDKAERTLEPTKVEGHKLTEIHRSH